MPGFEDIDHGMQDGLQPRVEMGAPQIEGLLKSAEDMDSEQTKRRRRAGELLVDPPDVPAPRDELR